MSAVYTAQAAVNTTKAVALEEPVRIPPRDAEHIEATHRDLDEQDAAPFQIGEEYFYDRVAHAGARADGPLAGQAGYLAENGERLFFVQRAAEEMETPSQLQFTHTVLSRLGR